MKIKAVNEDCFLITLGTAIDLTLTAKIADLNQQIKTKLADDLVDSTPAYTTILVQFNLLTISPLVVYKVLETLLSSVVDSTVKISTKVHRLPVYYHQTVAPDLLDLAKHKSMTVQQVIELHTQQAYQVCALGFSPGFAFLAEVNPLLQQARLKTPRAKVKAGSVAIADKQTAVYPSDSPGGWNIIGHCPLLLFNMKNNPISQFKVGDQVEFYSIDQQTYLSLMEKQWGKQVEQVHCAISEQKNTGLQVISRGLLATIQDSGRFSQSEQGVSQGGSADAYSANWANYLLANHLHCAVIEITVGGAEFLALSDVCLALTGANMNAQVFDEHNQYLQSINQQTFYLLTGQTLKLSYSSEGTRAYLAVKGGFEVVDVLGSCSTVMRNKIGGLNGQGNALKAGDCIPVKSPDNQVNPKQQLITRIANQYWPHFNELTKIGIIESYQSDQFLASQKQQLYQQVYTIDANSDRMGIRLNGQPLTSKTTGVISEAIALGSMQIPADGIPIILLQDRQTLGGYPKMGCVCRYDLKKLVQLPAGSKIQFYPIALSAAQLQYREHLQFFNRQHHSQQGR